MSRVDLFDTVYGHFTEDVLARVRRRTFGHDIGQNSWITVDEYDRFLQKLQLRPGDHLLEVASGSGGPSVHAARTTGCRVTGIDAHAAAVATAERHATDLALTDRVRFQVADATSPLPFPDATFDALVCVDSMNHFPDRLAVFREWRRVVKPGGRAVFTDPVVITGPVTSVDLELRASIGLFVFVPAGVNEQLIEQSGLQLLDKDDASDTAAAVARRWFDARAADELALKELEGAARYDGLQKFFDAVARLTSERRLSRIVYCVQHPENA